MSAMGEAECRRLLREARVARLATASRDAVPHLVPIVFFVDGNDIVFVVDQKAKSTTRLKRLRFIEENPAVSVLVDHYDEDWSTLWWVRADGRATTGEATTQEIEQLSDKYPQQVAVGPAVRIRIGRITGWRA